LTWILPIFFFEFDVHFVIGYKDKEEKGCLFDTFVEITNSHV
jgi:hypothetical protein